MFKRSFSERLINRLLSSDLYKCKVLEDIKTGVIFPCIRTERVDFYYKGGKEER